MLYSSLIKRAEELSSRSAFELPPLEQWQAQLPERRRQWLEMLGLDPLPERTDLKVEKTGVLDRGHYVVEKLHFQPVPDCRIPANLYRPKTVTDPLPGVVYVCGHSQRAKFHYQPHPRWFGEHGYVSIVLDPIQVGEGGGVHHGVVRHDWWHWSYFSGKPRTDPMGPKPSGWRILCGGHFRYSFYGMTRYPTSKHRPHYRSFGTGFRLQRAVP